MNAKALAFDLKFGQSVLRKEREEVSQLLHRKLCLGTARLILRPVPAAPAITLGAAAATLLLPGLLFLRALVSRRLCCAFLIAHSLFRLQAGSEGNSRPFISALNKAKSLNRPVGAKSPTVN
jgi:hypothetical protein